MRFPASCVSSVCGMSRGGNGRVKVQEMKDSDNKQNRFRLVTKEGVRVRAVKNWKGEVNEIC
jgi:hypothetical protein